MRQDAGSGSASSNYAGGMLKDLSLGGCSVALSQRPSWLRPGATIRLEFELPGLGHVTNLTGIVKNADTEEDLDVIDVEFRFGGLEYIEYRGWGGQRSPTPANIALCLAAHVPQQQRRVPQRTRL
jgi:hypothetical protein